MKLHSKIKSNYAVTLNKTLYSRIIENDTVEKNKIL